jgi:hypothetical protein
MRGRVKAFWHRVEVSIYVCSLSSYRCADPIANAVGHSVALL